MGFELHILQKPALLQSGSILKKLEYKDADEENLVRQAFQLAEKNNARIHLLTKSSKPCGFIALSIEDFSDSKSLRIEYIFTSLPYRKSKFQELSENESLLISEYLLGHSIKIASDLNAQVPIRTLSLLSAHEKLDKLYKNAGFTESPKKRWFSMTTPKR